ncbi:hypothetical protein HK105_202704 [Polyrhizophydium stewartii]|uniref:Cyclin-like domain-containing protein n=1 Tax=Polyrhizophydium stewartii TaxID=2732419 RepID=A0ABR4NE84_9FUNG|nr:hypothetical protein HK105_000018 [Polyrhizophydium stewartii]
MPAVALVLTAHMSARQLFEQSSQVRNWLLTAEQLEETRLLVNADGVRRLQAAAALEAELAAAEGQPLANAAVPQGITWREQLLYCRFYEGKIVDFCKFFGFDKTVQATAIVFFKRFYLHNTVMDYDPKIVLITCLFLSTKVENTLIPIDEFLSKIPKAPEAATIIDQELKVSQGLKFEFAIQHPYWPLHGLFLDMQSYLQSTQPRQRHPDLIKRLYAIYNQAVDIVTASLISDVSFQFMPSQIALAAMLEASHGTVSHSLTVEGLTAAAASANAAISAPATGAVAVVAAAATLGQTVAQIMQGFIADRFQNEEGSRVDGLLAVLAHIRETLRGAPSLVVDKASAGAVAAKLKTSMNPEFDPASRVFRKRRAETEREAAEKRTRKAEKARHSLEQLATVLN